MNTTGSAHPVTTTPANAVCTHLCRLGVNRKIELLNTQTRWAVTVQSPLFDTNCTPETLPFYPRTSRAINWVSAPIPLQTREAKAASLRLTLPSRVEPAITPMIHTFRHIAVAHNAKPIKAHSKPTSALTQRTVGDDTLRNVKCQRDNSSRSSSSSRLNITHQFLETEMHPHPPVLKHPCTWQPRRSEVPTWPKQEKHHLF